MNDYLWWRDGIIYQIYPRSFADSNGDGIGDLPGITARLDYLAELGIDAIWLSPFYPTPDADFGYDVSDHTAVDPRFGALADFDRLVAEAHRRGIRVVLDLVLNHTSDQHPWFRESRSSRDNPKRDWYIWSPPSDSPSISEGDGGSRRGVPNNWQSIFGGPGWVYDETTGQYYFHMFLAEQPDVNWRNPEVRKAQLDVARFWLERGADGFRLDVFNAYFKDAQFRSNPTKLGLRGFERQRHVYDCDQPEMIPLLNELRAILDAYPERYAVGETFFATPEKVLHYTGPDRLHAAFSFDFNASDIRYPWNPSWLLERIERREVLFTGEHWPTTVLSNHDIPRTATRYAHGEQDAQAKIAMALLLTLRGTPFMYYGEEIGMRDIHLRRSEIMDPPGRRYWPLYKGRDGCRSPMQWDDSPFAGFSNAKPWLPVHPNYHQRNVAAQNEEPDSLLNFTRKLIALRKGHPALRRGDFVPLTNKPRDALVYLRRTDEQTVLVALNFANRTVKAALTPPPAGDWQLLLSTARANLPHVDGAGIELAPCEVCILEEAQHRRLDQQPLELAQLEAGGLGRKINVGVGDLGPREARGKGHGLVALLGQVGAQRAVVDQAPQRGMVGVVGRDEIGVEMLQIVHVQRGGDRKLGARVIALAAFRNVESHLPQRADERAVIVAVGLLEQVRAGVGIGNDVLNIGQLYPNRQARSRWRRVRCSILKALPGASNHRLNLVKEI